MKRKVLVSSFDMEIGGVERSLIGMLKHFDYKRFDVDLMLYSHTGEWMSLLPKEPRLLPEVTSYKTFRLSIGQTFRSGELGVGLARLWARMKAAKSDTSVEKGFKQMQYMWKYALPYLPKLRQTYDVAISYLWPHYFTAHKVEAKTKIAWIHTDYSTADTDVLLDLDMWNRFDHIIAVSEQCKHAFLKKYPSLQPKVEVVENLTSPALIQALSLEQPDHPMKRDERFKLLTVARFSHAKGIDNAVRALRVVHDRGYSNIAWYVVGYGGDEAMIQQLIEEHQLETDFILLGKQTNPYPYMRAADLYVQPSRYEGKAVTVVEAQILAKPVGITNYPTAGSQLNNGVDGYIMEQSVEGIADGIEKLYLDEALRKQLADNCKLAVYGHEGELEKLYKMMN